MEKSTDQGCMQHPIATIAEKHGLGWASCSPSAVACNTPGRKRAEIFAYVEGFYNRSRRHFTLG